MNRATSALTFALLAVPLVACDTAGERADTGECPAGEVCSPNTPRGLHFIGNTMADELFGGGGPGATAIGGTQEVALEMERSDGVRVALAMPYQADDDGGLGVVVVNKTGSVVTVKGARSRSNYLRILDPSSGELFDRYTLTGAALTSMRLVGTSFERTPSDRTDLVFATGEQEIGVALVGEVQGSSGNKLERLVDTSMVLDLPGSTRTSWDSIKIASATPGTYPLMVTAGDKPAAAMPITVVAAADAIATLDAQPSVPAGGSSTVCFQATSNSRYIYGLVWTYTANGVTTTKGASSLSRNCLSVSSEGMTSGSIPVTASAGGKTLAVNVLIGQMARSATGVATTTGVERSVPTTGDRAAM